jgi:hypothetical protein
MTNPKKTLESYIADRYSQCELLDSSCPGCKKKKTTLLSEHLQTMPDILAVTVERVASEFYLTKFAVSYGMTLQCWDSKSSSFQPVSYKLVSLIDSSPTHYKSVGRFDFDKFQGWFKFDDMYNSGRSVLLPESEPATGRMYPTILFYIKTEEKLNQPNGLENSQDMLDSEPESQYKDEPYYCFTDAEISHNEITEETPNTDSCKVCYQIDTGDEMVQCDGCQSWNHLTGPGNT